MKIIHITSAHGRFDTRIFHKMCVSAHEAGHEVSLVVADGKGYEVVKGVKVYDVGTSTRRSSRILLSAFKAILLANKLDADIFQFHDPELLLYLRLTRRDVKIIFDFHEDVRAQIKRKNYIKKNYRNIISFFYGLLEKSMMPRVDGVITATEPISQNYSALKPTQIVANYPIWSEFKHISRGYKNKDVYNIAYVGGVTPQRGLIELVDSLELVQNKVVLHICGPFNSEGFHNYLVSRPGWKFVCYHGQVDRKTVISVLENSDVGMVTLLPDPSYEVSLPVKMFEYFAAGLPVVSSNFKLWSNILKENSAGVVVDPSDPSSIAGGIDELLSSNDRRALLGGHALNSVRAKYLWSTEYQKLNHFYSKILGSN
jgi:glycosyltransferase involved in cell wall biosynthesis